MASILLARRIVAAILAADLSRALLVCGLLLSPFITHDAVLGLATATIVISFALSFSHALLVGCLMPNVNRRNNRRVPHPPVICGTSVAVFTCSPHADDHCIFHLRGGEPIRDQPDLDSHEDLRSGETPWGKPPALGHIEPVARDFACGVLIVGAGITGSMLAARLIAEGHDVVLVDREAPGRGSTAASTAMLLWELDTSLAELTSNLGFDKAARILQLSHQASLNLAEWIETTRIPCAFARRPSLLLAAEDQRPDALRAEFSLRVRAALPSRLLTNHQLAADYGMQRAAALESTSAAEADPALLARALLRRAMAGGARVYHGEAVRLESLSSGAGVILADGVAIEARHVVLATGYDMPAIVHSDLHTISATWVVATRRLPQVWPNRALVWETAENYTYARTTSDRIIVGGLDDARAVEPDKRDALTSAKAGQLLARLAAIWPEAECEKAHQWSGAFGKTTDGLPLIGQVPGQPNIYSAYGYGGNGITFSYLATAIISGLLRGEHHATFDYFAIDRDT